MLLEDRLRKFNEIHDHKYDYSLVEYKNSRTKIKIICDEHGIFEQNPRGHMSGKGCRDCGYINKRISNIIERFESIHGDLYDYSLVQYKNNKTKVSIICNEHGIFKQIPINHLRGCGCPICKESKGEMQISRLLTERGIRFKREYMFSDCKNKKKLPFDFYLVDHNICIEYDGRHHFESVEHFGGDDRLEYTKSNDNIKNAFCYLNDITLVRIPYFNFDKLEVIINGLFH